MTALLIAAAYLAVTVVTGKWAYRKLMHNSNFDYEDSEDRFVSGFLSLCIGLFWPITIFGLALITIITGPAKGDTQ